MEPDRAGELLEPPKAETSPMLQWLLGVSDDS
jgi:hypothetical protein